MDTQDSKYDRLDQIFKPVQRSRQPYINNEDLTSLGIWLSSMSLRPEDTIDFEPRFSSPFPTELFNKLFAGVEEQPPWCHYDPDFNGSLCSSIELDRYFNEILGCGYYERDLIRPSKWNLAEEIEPFFIYGRGGLGGQNCDTYWRVTHLYRREPEANASRFLACTLLDGHDADNSRLLRSEIICAVRLVAAGIHMADSTIQQTTPVFIYSMSGRQARIIQAHFDGHNLIVRKTDYLDFKTENMENIKLYLRWMMNAPLSNALAGRKPLDDGNPEENFISAPITLSTIKIAA